MPHRESLNITGAITIEAWIKTNSNTTQQGIVERYNWLGTADDGGYGIRLTSDGRLQLFTVRIAGVTDGLNGNTVIQPGVWHHVAGVFDGANMRVYLDGVLDGSKASTLAPGSGTNNLKIGARGDVENFPLANALTFNGSIDDVRVTSGTVYWTNFKPQFPLTTGVVVEAVDGSGVRGYWDFDDQTVNDSSVNNNHGVLLNGAFYAAATINNEETIWIEDAMPSGGIVGGDSESWSWVSSNPAAFSGTASHQSPVAPGTHQHYFYNASSGLTINNGDSLVTYVYLDPANLPAEIMLQWNDGSWEHRAYWGGNIIPWGTEATDSRRYMGALPVAGQWVRLEIPASQVGLEGKTLNGMAFTLYGGRAAWDRAGKSSAAPVASSSATVWVEDSVPAGGATSGDLEGWNWVSANPTPSSGSLSHQSNISPGIHQHFFYNATSTLAINPGDTLFAYIYLDPANMPNEVMLQWNDGTWENRAYWGANYIPWGTEATNSRRHMGALPAAGQWVRLEVPAVQVGLEGKTLNGMAFTLHGGRATWDHAGKSTVLDTQPSSTTEEPHVVNFETYPLGTHIYAQYAPYATFTAAPLSYYSDPATVVVGDASGVNRPDWKAVWTRQGFSTKNIPLDVRFPERANNLHFYVLNARNYYPASHIACYIDVYQNNRYIGTTAVWSAANGAPVWVDFRHIRDISGLFIYNISAPAGPLGSGQHYTVFFDDFEFTTTEECPPSGTNQAMPCPTPTPTPTPEVTSVNFEATYSGQLPLNPNITLDGNASGGCSGKCGLRIYPDKLSPDDTVNRAVVKVRVNTTYPANTPIHLKAFDLDDPSTDLSPVDPNGQNGNDNKGGGTASFVANTDSSGTVRVDFPVTKFPGDNFMLAASADPTYLNGLTVDGIDLRDGAGIALPTKQAKNTAMLTVWRRLHIEVDRMRHVAGNVVTGSIDAVMVPDDCPKYSELVYCPDPLHRNVFTDRSFDNLRYGDGNNGVEGRLVVNGISYQVTYNSIHHLYIETPNGAPPEGATFSLYDDDDFDNSGEGGGDEGQPLSYDSNVLALMGDSSDVGANIFAQAYIQPDYKWATERGYNGVVPFALNVTDLTGDFQMNSGRDSRADEGDDFWVVYIQMGYQYDPNRDGDPNTERLQTVMGVANPPWGLSDTAVARGTDGAMVFLESRREGFLYSRNAVTLKRTAPHEIGHQMGLKGDNGCAQCGIMSYGYEERFVPQHINLLRSRVKSPGQ